MSTHQMVVECGPRVQDEDQVLLYHLIRRKGQTFSYEYDFGDCWQHEVKVEKILPYDVSAVVPVCLAGARACPPEDCGSFPGYANVLRVLGNAETPDDRDLREWVGSYDPEHFELEAVNRRLQPRRGRKSWRRALRAGSWARSTPCKSSAAVMQVVSQRYRNTTDRNG